MTKLGWCVVLGVALGGCKGKANDAATGSAGSGSAGSAGSAMTSPADAAAAVPVDAAVAVAVDAAAPDAAGAAFATTISAAGVGPITDKTAPGKLKTLFPGYEVTSEVQETEDSKAEWFTVAKDNKTLLKALVDFNVNSKAITRVLVSDPLFTTDAGIHVGSTGAELAAKYPDTKCEIEKFEGDDEKTLWCKSDAAKQQVFYLDTKGVKGKGKLELDAIATQPIKEIMWSSPEPKGDDE